MPAELQLFTSAEVAQILKMNGQVVTRKLQAGEIEGYKLGKDWRVSQAQLTAYLAKHSNQRPAARDPNAKTIGAFFDTDGKLKNLPASKPKRELVLRHLAGKLEANRVYSEAEVNDFIIRFHPDACTIRRELVGHKLMVRQAGKYKVASWNRET